MLGKIPMGYRIDTALNIMEKYPNVVPRLEAFLKDPVEISCPFSKIVGDTASDKTCSKYCEKVFPEIKPDHGCPCNLIGSRDDTCKFIKKLLKEYYKYNKKEEVKSIETMTLVQRKFILICLMMEYPLLKSSLKKYMVNDSNECPFPRDYGCFASEKTCRKYCYKVFPECETSQVCPCSIFQQDSVLSMIDECLDEFEHMQEYGIGNEDESKVVESKKEKPLTNKMNDGRFGLDDSKVATKLLDKNFSPMIIRKYTRIGFPLYIHMICDANLDDLDNVVHDCIDFCTKKGILQNSIQSLRNFTGVLSESINAHYDKKKRGCVESLGVIFYCDKMIISSLQGDCMNHESCRQELYDCLNLMTKI